MPVFQSRDRARSRIVRGRGQDQGRTTAVVVVGCEHERPHGVTEVGMLPGREEAAVEAVVFGQEILQHLEADAPLLEGARHFRLLNFAASLGHEVGHLLGEQLGVRELRERADDDEGVSSLV